MNSVGELKTVGETVSGNSYVGRGIVIGESADGENAAFAYFIMGRSENSRNRIFSERDGVLYTEPFDSSKVKDPSLIIYAAVRRYKDSVIVTNGDQTDTVYDFLRRGKSFGDALRTRMFEPDSPNFTPRISGLLTFQNGDFSYRMAILKNSAGDGENCERFFFEYPSRRGTGHFIHTYTGDGNPLPAFMGEPETVAIPRDIDGFTNDIWNNLDADNRISLYTEYINLATFAVQSRIVNKNI